MTKLLQKEANMLRFNILVLSSQYSGFALASRIEEFCRSFRVSIGFCILRSASTTQLIVDSDELDCGDRQGVPLSGRFFNELFESSPRLLRREFAAFGIVGCRPPILVV